jgi:hypothetical protein
LIEISGRGVTPLGIYEMPDEDSELELMAEAGINLVRAHGSSDLDRLHERGLKGWIPLRLQEGPSHDLKERVKSVVDHPALAVWEGPDEIVWGFTACSKLESSVGIRRDDWWNQEEKAVEYASSQAEQLLPRIREGIEYLRGVDPMNRQIWFNEAARSDLGYIRRYIDDIDVTGCDSYPFPKKTLSEVGGCTRRYVDVGRGKPVWMVLQGCARGEWNDDFDTSKAEYPSFEQSRFMAYDALCSGARGILYWGTHLLKSPMSPEFRVSLYAVVAELSALEPLLSGHPVQGISTRIIDDPDGYLDQSPRLPIQVTARRLGRDWVVMIVNEDDRVRMGVVVEGLDLLEGSSLQVLYGSETVQIRHGEFDTRMRPHQAKVFSTTDGLESEYREGRDFGS